MEDTVSATPSRVRSRFAKSASLGLNDILFSTNRVPWILFELVLVFFVFQMSVWLGPYGHWGQWTTRFIACGAIFSVCFVTVALGLGFYDREKRFEPRSIVGIGVIANFFAFLISLSFFYLIYYDVMGRWSFVFGAVGAFLGVGTLRFVLAWVLRKNPYRFTIIGQSTYMDELVGKLSSKGKGSQVYVHVPWQSLFAPSETATVDKLLEARVGDIVLTSAAINDPEVIEFAIQGLQSKLRVVDELDFYTQVFERLPIDAISKDWVLRQGIAKRQIITVAIKRWSDIALSAIALVCLSPVLAGIALAIKFSSPGPALFVQPRQGRFSKPFNMYKFRTMRSDVSFADAKQGFTQQNDPRITWIGRIIRPLHFDELPQLWNIFIGDMSIVGPRPEALNFAKKMRQSLPLYDLRYLVRPGLTGHAQLNQGYAMDSLDDTKVKLSFDLYYLCQHTFWLDLSLMLRTFFFLTRGAR